MLETVETLGGLAVLAAVAVATLRDRLTSDPGPDPVAEARDQYAAGEIDHAEFERRLAFHLDDRNARIRAVVEDVNDVGPQTSKAIAREYDSLDGLRATDRERLESVPGVGTETAAAVLERVE